MSARILVVDDNPANLDLMLYLLRAFGHEAEGVADGLAAFTAACGGGFTLVLTDILMPGIDGYELVRRLKGDPGLASLPVVAVTAFAMQGDRERIAAAGFDGYIAKPIEPQAFVSQIEAYLPRTSPA
ncbi:MAG: response regulator [Candidatus Cybelea sp.]